VLPAWTQTLDSARRCFTLAALERGLSHTHLVAQAVRGGSATASTSALRGSLEVSVFQTNAGIGYAGAYARGRLAVCTAVNQLFASMSHDTHSLPAAIRSDAVALEHLARIERMILR